MNSWIYPLYGPSWMAALPNADLRKLQQGHALVFAGKIYIACQKCHKVVRLNKPIFGALHVCAGGDGL